MKQKSNQYDYAAAEEYVKLQTAQLHRMQKELEIKKKARELHTGKIWQASDGRWATYFPNGSGGRKLVKRKNEIDLCKEVIKLYETGQAVPAVPTVEDCCRAFNRKKLNNGKIIEATYARNERAIDQHMEYLDFGRKLINAVNEDDLMEYFRYAGCGQKLTHARWSELKTIITGGFRWARNHGLTSLKPEDVISDLGYEDVALKQVIQLPEEQVYNVDDADLIKNYLASHPDRVNDAILALWATGGRKCDICALHKEDIDLVNGEVYIRRTLSETVAGEDDMVKRPRTETNIPKTRAGIRKIPIRNDWMDFWTRCLTYNPNGVYVFGKGDKWLPPETINSRLRIVADAAKTEHSLSPHKVRKTVYTTLSDAQLDAEFLNSMFGHTKVSTGEKYYHFNRRTAKNRQEILNSVPGMEYPI